MRILRHPVAGSRERTRVQTPAVEGNPGPAQRRGAPRVLWQAGFFALVGVANTLLDFAVYNLLTSGLAGWQRIPANVVSTTVAMTFSFVVNLGWVFRPQQILVRCRAFRFIWVTCCALYGLQNLVIWLASGPWSAPVDQLATAAVRVLPAVAGNEDLLARNLVKALATVASMTWNYFWYRFYAFRNF